jgi:hypothetical protein
MVPNYTTEVVEIIVLLETDVHCQTVVQFVLPSNQSASYMHLRLFPLLNLGLYNFFLYVPLTYKIYRKYSLVLSCTYAS